MQHQATLRPFAARRRCCSVLPPAAAAAAVPWPPPARTICKATAAPILASSSSSSDDKRSWGQYGGGARRSGGRRRSDDGGGSGDDNGARPSFERRSGPWRGNDGERQHRRDQHHRDQQRQQGRYHQQQQQQQQQPARPPTTARDEAVRQLLRIEKDGAYSGLVSGQADAARRGSGSSGDNGGGGSDDEDAWEGAAQLTQKSAELDARDQRLVKELVAGVTRWRRRLDFVAARLTGRGGEATAAPLKQVLRIGLYELLYMDAPAHVVSEHVDLAKRWAFGGGRGGRDDGGVDGGGGDAARAAAGFANRVLRDAARAREAGSVPDPATLLTGSGARDVARRLAIEHSHPTWLAARWVARFGADGAAALMRANNARPTYSLRANAAVLLQEPGDKNSSSSKAASSSSSSPAAQLLERLSSLPAVSAAPSALLPREFVRVESGLQAVLRAGLLSGGACAVQDESTGLAVALLDPQPGETVLDLCAAPGNKTLLAAARMRGEGRVVAADVSERRLAALRNAAARQRLERTLETFAGDAEDAVSEMLARPEFSGGFDKVLLDAPCSGTGVLAKRADLRWRREPEQLVELASLQARLLEAAARAVKRGGLLVFSTCSIESEEGRERVDAFLASPAGAGFVLEPPPEGLVRREALTGDGACVETLPHVHGVDGAFAARLRRSAGP